MTYDVIVVGARCAGSPTGMLLARRGYKVLVVDRAAFPSDALSTHYIQPRGIAMLQNWGLLDAVRATGCPPITEANWIIEGLPLKGFPPPVDGVAAAYGPRRKVLDEILLTAAADAGCDVIEGCTVDELVWQDDDVVGIRGRLGSRTALSARAHIVVGADGVNSTIARLTGARKYIEQPKATCLYYSYWSGIEAGYEVAVQGGVAIGAVPTNDGLTMVAIQWPLTRVPRPKDLESQFMQELDSNAASLSERLSRGTREERFRGTRSLPNYFRRAHGPGWALVGDAGYHRDPVTAHGISDAFRDAQALADAVDAGLGGPASLAQSLALYETERDTKSRENFDFTCMVTDFEAPVELMPILSALQRDQNQTDRFFGVIAGSVPVSEFLSTSNLEALLDEEVAVDAQESRHGGLMGSKGSSVVSRGVS